MALCRTMTVKLAPLVLVEAFGLAVHQHEVDTCTDRCAEQRLSWSTKCSWTTRECSGCSKCAEATAFESHGLALVQLRAAAHEEPAISSATEQSEALPPLLGDLSEEIRAELALPPQGRLERMRAFAHRNTSTDLARQCMPPGQLLFLHIMKNGGTSIDQFMACNCRHSESRCSSFLSLGPVELHEGDPNCAEQRSVCSTHGRYADREEICGVSFARPAKVFTVMRRPVDRVFSMYNYQKKAIHDKNGRILAPLADIFRDCQADCKDDLATPWLCFNLMNHMTSYIFAPPGFHVLDDPLNATHLEHAKGIVQSLDAVFFLEDSSTLKNAFASSKLLSLSDHCELQHSNPTVCEVCQDAPTEEEEESIKKNNAFDIQLYDWAKKLPNRFRL